MTIRVLHLVGSAVSDFYSDLSRLYAADCLESVADADRYEMHVAFVTPDLQWRFPANLSRKAIAAATPMPVATAIERITALKPDVMVPQMFCVPGMTSYRALFEVLDIPYVGNLPGVMALTANKALAKAVVQAAGVRVPRGEVLRPGEQPSIKLPAVVKPVDADNSLGVALVRVATEWSPALHVARGHASDVLVEEYIELGREVRCGILERQGELVCLPLEEYRMDQPVRGYAQKISAQDDGDLGLVAKDGVRAWIVDPADPVTAKVWKAAQACHVALGCRDYSLFDFRIDPAGEPWFLEASLYCSFAHQSVLSTMARSVGIDAAELFATALRGRLTPRRRTAAALGCRSAPATGD